VLAFYTGVLTVGQQPVVFKCEEESCMELRIEELNESELKEKRLDDLSFGVHFTDRMFVMEYDRGKGWHSARITKFQNFSLSPATMAFHYGQAAFEGLKAYPREGSKVALFRPEENFRRMNVSADRLCMPPIDEDFVLRCLEELIRLERDWVPRGEGQSLYIRPTYMGVDPIIRVRASDKYLFFIILSPVGAYFKNGFSAARILVETEYSRASQGGTGYTKFCGNYGASLKAGQAAQVNGYDQVLWLDACGHKYVEEVGSMNIFFVIDGKLVTPKLQGSILPGITRESTIILARDLGYEVIERQIEIEEVIEGIESGNVQEVFGTGTACVISPVGTLGYRGKDYIVNGGQIGEITQHLYKELTSIQYGTTEDRFGWIRIIE
jgi:branched-chain amino acid aminotransferase